MKKTLVNILGIAFAFCPILAFSQSYDSCRSSYRELLGSKLKSQRVNWVRVIKCFDTIASKESDQKKIQDSLFTVAMLYKQLYSYSSVESDLNNSLRYFELVAEQFPGSTLADDALYNRGKIYLEEKQDYTKAYLDLSEVVEKYPGSDCSKKSRRLIAEIKRKKPVDEIVPAPSGAVAESSPGNEKTQQPSVPVESQKAQIQQVKHWTNPDFTRVAIYLRSRATYTYGFVDKDSVNFKPARLFVDIKNSDLAKGLAGEVPIKDGLLTRARIARYSKDTTRIVLDAERDFTYSIVAWEDPFRIIIDIKSKDVTAEEKPKMADLAPVEKKTAPAEVGIELPRPQEESKKPQEIAEVPDNVKKPTVEAVPEKAVDSKKTETVSLPAVKKSPDFMKKVVIDPGHGGKDFGAVGMGGTLEKDVTLSIAKKVRDILSKDDSIEVIMTRDDDTFIPLEDRTGMAVQAQADLFVSIHVNAHKKRSVHGVSTYFLDDTDDQESIMTALKENYAGRDFVGSVDSKETKDFLSFTFASLQKNYDTIRSIPLADMVHKNLIKTLRRDYSRVSDLRVRKGVFWVLCGTNSPAVLVETSFISNLEEEKRLKSAKYQDAIARGIADGIKQYLKNPVAMTGYGYITKKATN